MLGVVQMGLLAWLLFAALVSATLVTLYPLLRSRIATLSPEFRATVLRWLAMLPAVGGLCLALLCFAPAAARGIFPDLDHCTYHGDGHLHFCMTHLSDNMGAMVGWLVVVGAGLFFVVSASQVLIRFRYSHRLVQQLACTASFDSKIGAWLVDSNAAFAMTTGVVGPKTLLSRGLTRALSPRLLAAVIAHERAHEIRNDSFWKLVIGVLSLAHLPVTRRAILGDIEFACEQACDEEAGAQVGDRVCVAEALLAVQRSRRDPRFGLAALSFGAQGVVCRVESLVSSRNTVTWSPRITRRLLCVGALVLCALADPMHHLAETLIGLLVS